MDDRLAHISEDEFYSEEDRKEKEKETTKSKEKEKESKDKDVKEKEVKPAGKQEEEVVGEESDHSTDDPSGERF